MAATGFTPISLYYSTTASAVPLAANLANGELALNTADMKLYSKNSAGVVTLLASSGGAAGTVSSVAQSFTGGLISVSGSPITTSGTLALTVAGTSGGIPYFSSASTWATSAALAASSLVVGGGAGAAPSTVTTGTGVVTALGVNTGSAGAFVVNGGALGTPSSGTVTNLTGTASININGTVGATTPTTGAFTTLAASSSVTLSGGTANGVTYLNGSKVLTSGSALTFDGNKLQINSSAASYNPLTVQDTATSYAFTNNFVAFYNSTSAMGGIGHLSANDLSVYALGNLAFGASNTEGMRLTSTGLGIGTSSLVSRLTVKASGGTYATGSLALVGSSSGTSYITNAGGTLYVSNDGSTDQLVLNSAGNLGLGVTPSAWASNYTALQVKNASIYGFSSYESAYSVNAYYNGSWKYISSTNASRYDQVSGVHSWHTAASGTAGTAISFTQAMTLDASGNLLLGATSDPAGFATPQRFAFVADTKTDGSGIYPVTGSLIDSRAYNSSSPPAGGGLGFGYKYSSGGATAIGPSIQGYKENTTDGDYGGGLRFLTRPNGGGPAERARISSTGGFSVGTTANPGAGAIYATGAITAFYSDARLKTVSGKIEDALDKVSKLSGVYYTNNDTAKSFGYTSDEVQVGVLAQEIEAVLPQVVKAAPFDLDENGNSKSGQNYKTVQYEKLVPLLIEAINELRAEVTALKGTI